MAKQPIYQPVMQQTRLPQWANGLIVVGAVAAVGAIAYLIYKKSKEKEEKKTSEQTVTAVNSEIQAIQNQGGTAATLSFPMSRYQTAANTVATLLDGCETSGTELKAIQEVAECVKKPIDWLTLVKVFGVRKIDNCGIGTGETTYDLPTLLKDQLDSTIAVYTMDVNGYKKTGSALNSISILRDYLKFKGVNI